MKKSKPGKILLLLLGVLLLSLSALSGCNRPPEKPENGTQNTEADAETTAENEAKEPVTGYAVLKILNRDDDEPVFIEDYYDWNFIKITADVIRADGEIAEGETIEFLAHANLDGNWQIKPDSYILTHIEDNLCTKMIPLDEEELQDENFIDSANKLETLYKELKQARREITFAFDGFDWDYYMYNKK